MRRLLLIQSPATPFPAAVGDIESWGGEILCERVDWGSFLPNSLRTCHAALVMPVAVAEPRKAMDLFRWLREHPIAAPTLAVLADQTEADLLQAASDTVDDFILWPAPEEELRLRVHRLLGDHSHDVDALEGRLLDELGMTRLVGRDPAFLRTISQIPAMARSGSSVLLTGETGTGKELCARAIHHMSARRAFPFIPVDCGAVPDHLFENELFGHVRGAFTDAHGDQRGLVAMANGGTLFLDEVDALSLPAQAKLLRFLEERSYRPLGADRFARADVNVVSATNRDLERLVREKAFRADLFFRLHVLRLHLAPLRERRGDIPLLARHFVESLCAGADGPHKTLAPATLSALAFYDWPGNVRELYNVMQRAVVFAEGAQILPRHVALGCSGGGEPDGGTFRQARARAVETFEKRYVEDLLGQFGGNVTRAAREAHKDRRAFGRLIKKYEIDRSRL